MRQGVSFLLFYFLIVLTKAVNYEGDICVKDGVPGTCRLLGNCQAAIIDLQNRKRPQICSFAQREPIVCCLDSAPAVVTTTRRTTTTTEYVPPAEEYEDVGGGAVGSCPPIPPNLTSTRTGKKAWDKCLEYQERFVYPCTQGAGLAISGTSRQRRCHHKTEELIIDGENAANWEFPHIAMLGFGDTPENWICAGTIISEKFIVTAGHCTYSRESRSNVTYARIGTLRKKEQLDTRKVYKISRIIKNPAYDPPRRYDDIALLETELPMSLDEFTVPACLDVGTGVVYDSAVAAGWGLTQYNGQEADVLQKVTLQKFTDAECTPFYRPGPNPDRNFKKGYQPATQLCYGDKQRPRDSCQGDSGGPLQVKNRKLDCMYTLIGVISFGKGCGNVGVPAIYTRVSYYVDWIERIVWP